MSGKLDQALDDITQAQRRSARRRSTQRRSTGRPVAAAPIGGIQKSTKPARGAGAKNAPAKAAPTNSDSKIIVSNLVSPDRIIGFLFRLLTSAIAQGRLGAAD